jgi:uncharacterized protein (DUF1919 family)
LIPFWTNKDFVQALSHIDYYLVKPEVDFEDEMTIKSIL